MIIKLASKQKEHKGMHPAIWFEKLAMTKSFKKK